MILIPEAVEKFQNKLGTFHTFQSFQIHYWLLTSKKIPITVEIIFDSQVEKFENRRMHLTEGVVLESLKVSQRIFDSLQVLKNPSSLE